MGALTPLAVKIGSISWMPRYLPQIVYCDNLVQRLTRQRYGLLDIAGLPNITLRVAGRRSGVMRTTRLLAVPVEDGRWLIAGSYFGGPDMPQWVYNLRAAGEAEMSSRGHPHPVTARELDGAERSAAWERLRSVWPNFDLYVTRTDRTIPVFQLDPV
ncbi:nitroreductase family deazaflavin-dependent oxidoreductase [Gordonia sp. CPCC 205515]|uniref:nitroreductase family deazaflavin-dependent oxidoreductase n=1 Tax=Gordonia sp. CPCC 205515 TaxID=3140791 RepID=UPI003AF378AC